MDVVKKYTPNFTKGRNGYKPEIIVLHISDGSLSSMDSWFAIPQSQVSAHYGVGLKGEYHQYVQETDTAWANGRVKNPSFNLYKKDINPNKYTISIEHEGKNLSKAPEKQLQATAELIRAIACKWNICIDREHIIGHYQIFADKPNCPSVDKSIIDKIIQLASSKDTVTLEVPIGKIDRVRAYMESIV